MLALVLVLVLINTVATVASLIWRERQLRRLRRRFNDCTPMIAFVAAIVETESIAPRVRQLARDVLPDWAEPRQPSVRTMSHGIH